ncbi:L-threonine 3-dehydrogenase [Cryobacterium psychrotolerans]|uniref:L-threonine 3-dehydrogenase n=1 Tax=Cryobacterium psychrotolerans TaxID=386301 RepID=A0A1G9DVW1_9MICO|nr:L-threonine 3-dehydrogenase [Cryobacterium psychrotolerans]SDK68005.1 L-threonine 3-dehydrogenase [Cryobacterium psychrotolerans]
MHALYTQWSVTSAHAVVIDGIRTASNHQFNDERKATSVLALFKPSGAPGLELVDRPEPRTGDDEVKIRVLRTGICGTDLHIESWDSWAAGTISPPIIPGHEFYGEVVEVGSQVRDVHVGARVSGEGHIVCGNCRNCRAGRRQMCIRTLSVGVNRDGAFAEYVVIPESNVWVHLEDIGPDLGAIFDPFGNAVHTALSFPLVGEDVLITGAGPIGLMAAAVARHVGARFVVVTDVSEPRLALARQMGADLTVNVAESRIADAQRTLGMREGFDVGFEMSGHPGALPEMITNLNHGGRVAMLGLPSAPIDVDWARVVTHMLTIKGIYGREMYETWVAMSAMLQSSEWLRDALSSVITDRFPAARWQEGFDAARAGTGGKVVLDWSAL